MDDGFCPHFKTELRFQHLRVTSIMRLLRKLWMVRGACVSVKHSCRVRIAKRCLGLNADVSKIIN